MTRSSAREGAPRTHGIVLGLVVPISLVGCMSLKLGEEPSPPSEVDAAAIGTSSAVTPPSLLCTRDFAPRPRLSSEGPNGRDVYVLAVSDLGIGRGDGGALPGVDQDCLDTRCGGVSAPSQCIYDERDVPCDGPGGVDNRLGEVLGTKLVLSEQPGKEAIRSGARGQLIFVRNYNGLPDDPSVEVAVVPSPGFAGRNPSCVGDGIRDDAGARVPAWDGCDQWLLNRDDTVGGDPGIYVPGYVTGSRLYVRSSGEGATFALQLGSGVARVELPGMVATLERLAGFDGEKAGVDTPARLLRMKNGTIFGRVGTGAVLDFVSRLRPDARCLSYTSFVAIRRQVCAAADLPVGPTSQGRPCDAFSLGVRVEATYAERAAAVSVVTPAPCLEGAPDGLTDRDGGLAAGSELTTCPR